MISGDEWREAFLWGLATGIPVGAVLAWLLWWIGVRTDRWGAHEDEVQQMHAADQALNQARNDFGSPCICGTVFEINGPCCAKVHTRPSSHPWGVWPKP
jgi:hypothetical protein